MKIALFFFLIMCGMGAVGYFYYNDTQDRLAQLRENNTRLEIAAQTSQETIGRMQEDMLKMK